MNTPSRPVAKASTALVNLRAFISSAEKMQDEILLLLKPDDHEPAMLHESTTNTLNALHGAITNVIDLLNKRLGDYERRVVVVRIAAIEGLEEKIERLKQCLDDALNDDNDDEEEGF